MEQYNGYANVFIGLSSGYYNIGGHWNVFLGTGAGYHGTGWDGKTSNMFIVDNAYSTYDESFIYGEIDNNYIYFYADMEVEGNITYWDFWGTSDAKYKKRVQPYSNALNQIKQLQGVTYEWNADEFKGDRFPEGKQLGLIAQDVEKVIPELVRTDREGNKAVNYTKLTTVLIEAMKEQQKMIE